MSKLTEGIRHPIKAARYLYNRRRVGVAFSRLVTSRYLPLGQNIFEFDWNLLVVLDSCRVDALREVSARRDRSVSADDVTAITSVGGSTLEWTAMTFSDRHRQTLDSTGFVSANGWPYRILREGFRPPDRWGLPNWPFRWPTVDESDLLFHLPAWQYGGGRAGWSDQPQADAETVVDLAIRAGRADRPQRLIVHLIEPHYPYAAAARRRGALELADHEQQPREHLKSGGNLDVVWNAYLEELRAGLEEVERLLANYDADAVVITADHGEAFGEWGQYGHGSGSFNPVVRRVPFVRTSASDEETSTPDSPTHRSERSVTDSLEALGYL